MDNWKRSPDARRNAWSHLQELRLDVALLQEAVPERNIRPPALIWREIAGHRRFGSAIAAYGAEIEEIWSVRSRFSSRVSFQLYRTFPGAVVVARVKLPNTRAITAISMYGVIDVYSSTTILRMVADLMPLFDSPDGEHVVLGGDLNISTGSDDDQRRRHDVCLRAVESLGLVNLFADERHRRPTPGCLCGDPAACYHVQTHRHASRVGTERELLPGHLDYLFASPQLAKNCEQLALDNGSAVWEMSDHCPVIAEFDLAGAATEPVSRTWHEDALVDELRGAYGTAVGRVAEELLHWGNANRLRLAFNQGNEGQCWFMLGDARSPQWSFSIRTRGDVVVQFQYMTAPFESAALREPIRQQLNSIPGVSIETARLGGRPEIPLAALVQNAGLKAFLDAMNQVVIQTRIATAVADD